MIEMRDETGESVLLASLREDDAAALRALARMTLPVTKYTLAEHVPLHLRRGSAAYYSAGMALSRLRRLGLAEPVDLTESLLRWVITPEGEAALSGSNLPPSELTP